MNKFVKLTNDGFCHYGYGSNLNLAHAAPDKKYIQHLVKCRNYATAKDIYPGIKHPFRDDLVKLWQLKLVDRYSMPKYIKADGDYVSATRVWWKITPKGERLLKKLGL